MAIVQQNIIKMNKKKKKSQKKEKTSIKRLKANGTNYMTSEKKNIKI